MSRLTTSFVIAVAASLMSFGCADGDSGEPNQKAVEALASLGENAIETGADEVGAEQTKTQSSTEKKQASDKAADTKAGKSDGKKAAKKQAIATFGNGCYWCTESVFQQFKGIKSVVSGFSGGEKLDVTYREVCSGTTGHAEVVQVTYDPTVVSYAELLQAFFLTHDPTTLNRQGADVGTQYRSVIFYHDDTQKTLAKKAIKELTAAKAFKRPIVTEVSAYKNFVKAKKEHQDYFDKNPGDRYCLYNIPKKVAKIRKVFKDKVVAPKRGK